MFRDKLLKKLDKANKKTIILPEGEEERTLKAAKFLLENNYCNLILIGDKEKISDELKELNNFVVLNPSKDLDDEMINFFYELRKHKGISVEDSKKILNDNIYFGTTLLKMGKGDGLVSGAIHSTADTVKPALQIIKTKKGINKVTSCFFMSKDDKTYVFTDCAINPEPNAKDLAESAYLSDQIAAKFDSCGNIAFISYSTKGSAKHKSIDKIIEAVNICKNKWPELKVDGELQIDAAIIKSVAKQKAPNSNVAGDACILIFPNLDSGNVAYKLVERLGDYRAIGPILLGLEKPMNDLSRGCSVDDIIDVVLATCVQSQEN